ncbi:glycosyltransferase family 4 protein [Winogradskyella sediminis]|uniref:Glycosyltransferase involved in cell wall bisynthesis n=1 Tax=Winogradskyella sediminis TaxID=1382466 RepID=A0A1H1NNL0_9FLAO|nr:glycosyltransferase family 1 protein [Winogradskyella sediminis]SDR99899.1 Glycosyltransferase involved in cell wall bisynthesis [Winogradskyella sediminis]
MRNKIFIDLHHIRNTKKGFGQYAINLAKGIVQNNIDGLNLYYYVPLNGYQRFGSSVNYKLYLGLHRRRNNFKNYNVWHSLTHLSKVEPQDLIKTKIIYTVHDAIFTIINIPEEKRQQATKLLQSKINKSDCLVFISKFTQDCIREHFTIPDTIQQYVIYNGNPMEGVQPIIKTLNEQPYLLCVGEYRKYKNHSALIPMLAYLDKNINLVFMGKYSKENQEKIISLAKEYQVENRIIFKASVSERKKIELYSNAKGLVHPSLAEGFGFPVVEAMSLGIPVFISNNTALPEVGGTVAHYWDHYEPNYMAKIVSDGLDDFKKNKAIRTQELHSQASKFSWKRIAKQYIDVYKAVLDKTPRT